MVQPLLLANLVRREKGKVAPYKWSPHQQLNVDANGCALASNPSKGLLALITITKMESESPDK